MRNTNTLRLYVIAVFVLVLDQITKYAARHFLKCPTIVIPGILEFELSYNTGGAFGILPNWAPLFIIVSLVAIFAIVRLKSIGSEIRSLPIGLGLLMGGAIGNLIDRIFSPLHAVTDFIKIGITVGGKNYSWPSFNIADVSIVVGVILMIYFIFIVKKREEPNSET